MKLKNFASKYDMSEDDMKYAFAELGYFKGNGEPKNAYVKKGYFSDSGDVLDTNSVTELVDEKINEIKRAMDMKQIEELQGQVEEVKAQNDSLYELVESLVEKLDSVTEQLEEIKNNPVVAEPPKKQRRQMSEKEKAERMKTRARALIGKKINGWTVTGDKLDVVCTKKGYEEIRVSGMSKREDLEETLKDN